MTKAAVHLLLGPETGEKDRFLDELKAGIKKASGAPPEVTTAYTFDTQIGDLLAILRNGSLFSAHRLVVLKGADAITKKADIELLAEYCAHPVSEATLCLIADTTSVDKRLEKAVPAQAKRIFWELFENQKRSWLGKYFRDAGISISPAASELLLEMVENNTHDMRVECDKLTLFFGKGSKIEESDIESYIYHSKEENVFTLFDRVAAKDFAGALEVIGSILLSGEANGISLLSGLLWQFRRLHEVRTLLDNNYGTTEACAKAGIRSKRQQRTYLEGSKSYGTRDLERIISLVARYDALLRSMRSEVQGLLLELFLYYCIVKRGREPEPYRA